MPTVSIETHDRSEVLDVTDAVTEVQGESPALQGYGENFALAVVRETYVSRDDETLRVSNHNRKAPLFEDGDESDSR